MILLFLALDTMVNDGIDSKCCTCVEYALRQKPKHTVRDVADRLYTKSGDGKTDAGHQHEDGRCSLVILYAHSKKRGACAPLDFLLRNDKRTEFFRLRIPRGCDGKIVLTCCKPLEFYAIAIDFVRDFDSPFLDKDRIH